MRFLQLIFTWRFHPFLFLIVFTSCKKISDTTPPTITFVTPHENDTLTNVNQEYEIKFLANDETNLLSETLTILDENNTPLSTETRSIYGVNYNYSNTFSFGGTPGKIKKLQLKVEILDEAKNRTTKTVCFYIKT
jgi:hypothetical protein